MALMNKSYEPCKSCETLRNQLSLVNEENKRLTDAIIDLVKPKEIRVPELQPNSEPIKAKSISWAERRRMLEEQSRAEASAIKSLKDFNAKVELEKINEELESAN
jgi:hypothetical protein